VTEGVCDESFGRADWRAERNKHVRSFVYVNFGECNDSLEEEEEEAEFAIKLYFKLRSSSLLLSFTPHIAL
jgi:hypothetical protein